MICRVRCNDNYEPITEELVIYDRRCSGNLITLELKEVHDFLMTF